MIEIKKNKSSTYLLPLFNQHFKVEYPKLLVNTYLFYDDIGEDVFCILYKFNGKTIGKYGNRQGFPVYEERLRNHELYLGEADYGPFVLYQFRLPDELIETKHKFIEGKYSTFEDKYKKIIIQTMLDYYGVNVASAISNILYKSKQLREHMETKLMCLLPNGAELSSVINLNEEIFINCVKKEETKHGSKRIYGASI